MQRFASSFILASAALSVGYGCSSGGGDRSKAGDLGNVEAEDASSKSDTGAPPTDDTSTVGSDGSTGDSSTTDGTEPPEDTAPAGCQTHGDCGGETPFCDVATGDCGAPPPGSAIGWGLGATVTIEVVYKPSRAYQATALDFHPLRDELWVTLREFPTDEPCEELNATYEGCVELEGSVAIITGALTAAPKGTIRKDLNAWHFMRRPTSIAFGDGEFFATCAEARTGNYEDDLWDFMGPTLWSADPEIFAQDPGPNLNGSHMDMLHLTPYCMGIAHEVDNVYWTFNGQAGAIEQYDFASDHGAGHDDHTDGRLRRYVTGQVKRIESVPSHLVRDPSTGLVYVADSGNGRVVSLDVSKAKPGSVLPAYEAMKESREYDGAVLIDVVPPGTIAVPSGIALHGGALYVSDPTSARIYAFDLKGKSLGELDTELPSGTLSGLVVHPVTGVLLFTEMKQGRVFRVDITP